MLPAASPTAPLNPRPCNTASAAFASTTNASTNASRAVLSSQSHGGLPTGGVLVITSQHRTHRAGQLQLT